MNTLRHVPLGEAVPDSPHAVCCSLPRLEDVIGYEERAERVLGCMRGGYPRFVCHPLVEAAVRDLRGRLGLEGRSCFAVRAPWQGWELARFAGAAGALVSVVEDCPPGFALAHFPEEPRAEARARKYVQHTGCGISSRLAEDYLIARGLHGARHPEAARAGAEPWLREELGRLYGARAEDVALAASGMSAFYAAFRAVREVQRPRGRRRWLQLGWLYLDTGEVLRKMLLPDEQLVQLDALDDGAVEAFFAEAGDGLAGVVAEVPTNPLMQTPGLVRLSERCRAAGAALIIDPTIASPVNVDVLPLADVLVSSLTKYGAAEGDVLAGVLVGNRGSPLGGELAGRAAEWLDAPYARDAARLAAQAGHFEEVVNTVDRNVAGVVDWLERRPEVTAVHWARAAGSRANFEAVSRKGRTGSGCLVSFELEPGLMRAVHDHARLVKGPSFGARFSILCPFIYLAHYELVTSEAGRARLAAGGVSPELLRLSVGCERPEDICAALGEGFAVAGG